MAIPGSEDRQVLLADGTGTLRNISAYVTGVNNPRAQDVLENTGLNTANRTFQPGIAGPVRIAMNGFLNDTAPNIKLLMEKMIRTASTDPGTRALVIAEGTTSLGIYRANRGTVYAENFEISGDMGQLRTFSAAFVVSGAWNSTSVIT